MDYDILLQQELAIHAHNKKIAGKLIYPGSGKNYKDLVRDAYIATECVPKSKKKSEPVADNLLLLINNGEK